MAPRIEDFTIRLEDVQIFDREVLGKGAVGKVVRGKFKVRENQE